MPENAYPSDALGAGAPMDASDLFIADFDWPWPLSQVGWWFEAGWEFFRDTVGKVASGVESLFKPLFSGYYSWMRSVFVDRLSLSAQGDYPPGEWWWSLNDYFGRSLRLPLHALLSVAEAARDQVGSWLSALEQIPYKWFRDTLVVGGVLGPGLETYFPAPDPSWPLGTATVHLQRLISRGLNSQVWAARDWLQARIAGLGDLLTPIITGVQTFLQGLINSVGAVVSDTWTGVNTLIGRIPTDLGDILARIKTAVLTDLPATLGGLAQAVADKVGPLITAAIAGLGDLPAGVKALIKPLLDSIGTQVGNFATATGATLTGIITTLAGITLAVITTLPGLLGGIIPAITAALTNVQTALSTAISGIVTTLSPIISGVQTTLSPLITGVQTTLSPLITGVQTTLSPIISGVQTTLGASLTALDTFLQDKLAKIKSALDQLPSDLPGLVLGRLRSTLDDLGTSIGGVAGDVRNRVKLLTDDLGASIAGVPALAIAGVKLLTDALGLAVAGVPALAIAGVKLLTDSLGATLAGIPDQLTILGTDVKTTLLKPIMGGQDLVNGALDALRDLIAKIGDSLGAVSRWLDDMSTWTDKLPRNLLDTRWLDLAAGPINSVADAIATAPLLTDFRQLSPNMPGGASSTLNLLGATLNYAGRYLDQATASLTDWVKGLGYMSPLAANNTVAGVLGVVRNLGIGLAGFSLVGETIGFWKHIGLGHVSAMLWNLSNYGLLTGAFMGAIAKTAIATPIGYYYNDLLRPNLPPLADLSLMYAKHEITPHEFEIQMGFQGFTPEIISTYERTVFKDPRLFEVVRLAEITEPPPNIPPSVVEWLARANIPMADTADWWYYYKFGKAGYEDIDIPVLVNVAKMAVSRKEQTAYMTQVRRLYRDGFIEDPKALELLRAGWVPRRPIEFRMAGLKLEREYEELQEKRGIILAAMARGIVNELEAYQGMLDLGMQQARAALTIMARRLGLVSTQRLIPAELGLLRQPEDEED